MELGRNDKELGLVMDSVGKVVDLERAGKQGLEGKAGICAGAGVKVKPNSLGLAPFAPNSLALSPFSVVGKADKVEVVVVDGAVADVVVDTGV